MAKSPAPVPEIDPQTAARLVDDLWQANRLLIHSLVRCELALALDRQLHGVDADEAPVLTTSN